jgi:hypothetical protein
MNPIVNACSTAQNTSTASITCRSCRPMRHRGRHCRPLQCRKVQPDQSPVSPEQSWPRPVARPVGPASWCFFRLEEAAPPGRSARLRLRQGQRRPETPLARPDPDLPGKTPGAVRAGRRDGHPPPAQGQRCRAGEWAGSRGLPLHLVLTKADKLGRGKQKEALMKVRRMIDENGSACRPFPRPAGQGWKSWSR